jgi:hypothetical protein
MSPALLSKRLKDLEAAGILSRSKVAREPGVFEYRLTDAGRALGPVVDDGRAVLAGIFQRAHGGSLHAHANVHHDTRAHRPGQRTPRV